MGRVSSIKKLPKEVQDEITRLRGVGFTIKQLVDHLAKIEGIPEISHSAMGRYIQDVDKAVELLQQSRGLGEALIDKLGDAPESKTARFNIELVHALLTRLLLSEMDGKPATFSPEDMHFLARVVKDLGAAKKSDVEALQKIEERAAIKARTEAASIAERIGRERGLTADTVKAIREQILGVKAPAPATGG
jgi:hypothetical protein